MEERPRFPLSPEEDDDEDDENDSEQAKKKRTLADILLESSEKSKRDVGKDIAKSIFESSDTQHQKKQEQTRANELSPEEEELINKSIASDHLDHPITYDPPAESVTDFLEKVVDGVKPDNAFEATAEQYGFDDGDEEAKVLDPKPLTINEVPSHTIEHIGVNQSSNIEHPKDYIPSYQIINNVQRQSYDSGQKINEVSTAANTTTNTARKTKEAPATAALPSFLATDLASYILGKREGKKQTKEKLASNQNKIEKKVKVMERDLGQKELVLQQLSTENLNKKAYLSAPEKTQTATKESQVNLSKPKSAEHLGRVVVGIERPKEGKVVTKEKIVKPNNLRQYYRPEYVRTMRRQELMAVSEKIIIEGASLKHMYDNGLFSERALRRLVTEYMKDRDIVPKLRREIIEKQIDYERDPLLRDHYHRDNDFNDGNKSVFEQMLEKVEILKEITPTPKKQKDKNKIFENKPKSPPRSVKASNYIINFFLAIAIVILVGLIIYLLLKG